jgi:uncharacterized membrane protein YbhN (UPF0104 family)
MTETVHRGRSRRSFLVRLAVGLVMIGAIVATTDLNQLARVVRGIDPRWIAASLVLQLAAALLWAARWEALLEIYAMPVRFFRLVKALYIGMFLNNVLPTSVGGDVYRSFYILDEKKMFRKSVFVTFLERLIGVIILACISAFALGVHFLKNRSADGELLTTIALPLAVVGAVVLLQPNVYLFFNRLLFPENGGPLSTLRAQLGSALRTFDSSGARKWKVYFQSFLMQMCGIVLYFCVGRSLGIALAFWHYVLLVPIVVILTLVPISFNGIGLREGGLIFVASALGLELSNSQAVALGMMVVAVMMINSLAGVYFYMADRNEGAQIRELEAASMGEASQS